MEKDSCRLSCTQLDVSLTSEKPLTADRGGAQCGLGQTFDHVVWVYLERRSQ